MALDRDFFLMAPVSITETELISGIPDAENEVWDVSTTYDADALVWYAGKVYRSVAGSNLGNTPGGAEWTDLGNVDQGALAYDVSTTYNTDDYAVYSGSLWKCNADSTLGVTPTTAATEWTEQGKTNRLKAFDGFIQDAATLTGGIPYVIQHTELITEIAIIRADNGDTVDIVMTDATDGEVYNESFELQDNSGIIDAWTYFFNPFVFQDTVLAEDLPPYAGATIEITLNGSGAISVGQIVLGAGVPLGTTKVGTSVGIESYSKKDRDDFNRSIVVSRPYSDTVDFDLTIDTLSVSYVKRRLAEREALATLYYMSGGALYGTIAYGFFQNFEILHSSPVQADCILEIEGLG